MEATPEGSDQPQNQQAAATGQWKGAQSDILHPLFLIYLSVYSFYFDITIKLVQTSAARQKVQSNKNQKLQTRLRNSLYSEQQQPFVTFLWILCS